MDNSTTEEHRTDSERRVERDLGYRYQLLLGALLITSNAWADVSNTAPINAAPVAPPAELPKFRFNLPANPFPVTVLEFYHQSRIEVIYSTNENLREIKTHPVRGEYNMEQALKIMLIGTPLTFEKDKDNTVIVKRIYPEQPSTDLTAPERSAHRMAALTGAGFDSNPLEQVVVTGTLLHGVTDVTAPLVYVTKKELSQASYGTVQDALYSMPINSLSGPREDLSTNNAQFGAGVNLRGLGVGATLVLINGHRQPLSGLNGDFVDVSTIPWSAVERIEVLPEGASALYGSDAIAGVVNIIMRDDLRGSAETQTRFGAAPGGRTEKLASQLFSKHWDGGKVLLAYQYSDATELAAADRAYAADADKTAFGGGDYRTYYSDPGNILSPQTMAPTYTVLAGQSGLGLTSSALSRNINLTNQFTAANLFPERTSHLVYLTASQKIGENLQLLADARFGARDVLTQSGGFRQTIAVPSQNPYFVDPFGGSSRVYVAYNFLKDLGPSSFSARTQTYVGDIEAKWTFAENWHASLSETYGRERLVSHQYNEPDPAALNAALAGTTLDTAFDPFGNGTNPALFASINRDYVLRALSGTEATTAVVDGPIFNLPAGDAKLAVGLERRTETLGHDVVDPTDPLEKTVYQTYSRHVSSAYSELSIPLQGDPEKPTAVPRLELTLAGRFEDYSDFGHTFNPTARLRWIPADWLKLRASWGRSFRAPKLDDLYDTSQNVSFLTLIPDPQSPTGSSLVLGRQGDNPNLQPETATSWVAGFDLAPIRGFRFSLSYYAINYQGRIAQPASDDPFNILVHQAQWAPVITRNPTAAQIAAICNSPDFRGASPAECLSSSPAAIVDLRLANLAATKVRGFDLDASQFFDSRFGSLGLGINGNYTLHFDQAVTSTSPSLDVVNTLGNPVGLRLRATADWSEHRPSQPGWGASLALAHTGGYRNPGSTFVPRVGPFTTLDCQIRYRTLAGSEWWNGMEFSANAVNVFNKAPPFVDSTFGYDAQNFQPLGRVISMFASKSW